MRGINRSPVNSPHKGQWRGALIFFVDLRLNKRLSKQWSGWWFETLSCPFWRHCNDKRNRWLFRATLKPFYRWLFRRTLEPFHKEIMSCKHGRCDNMTNNNEIMSQFYTKHYIWTVVTCANFCLDQIIRRSTARINLTKFEAWARDYFMEIKIKTFARVDVQLFYEHWIPQIMHRFHAFLCIVLCWYWSVFPDAAGINPYFYKDLIMYYTCVLVALTNYIMNTSWQYWERPVAHGIYVLRT